MAISNPEAGRYSQEQRATRINRRVFLMLSGAALAKPALDVAGTVAESAEKFVTHLMTPQMPPLDREYMSTQEFVLGFPRLETVQVQTQGEPHMLRQGDVVETTTDEGVRVTLRVYSVSLENEDISDPDYVHPNGVIGRPMVLGTHGGVVESEDQIWFPIRDMKIVASVADL